MIDYREVKIKKRNEKYKENSWSNMYIYHANRK